MRKMLIFLVVIVAGCQAPPKVKYSLETSSPDVWDTNPKQSITARVEVTH